jgi:hypothetical protein
MKKITLFGFLLVAALALAACNMPGSLPTCPTDELLAPVLVAPSNGGSVSSLSPTLTWAYPDSTCNPEGYRIDLSIDEDFADTSLSGGTGNPSTNWGPGRDLENCQVYYWRVAAINDVTLGPFSDAHAFRVDLGGACPPVAPPPSAAVGGIVWHDLCATPDGPAPDPLPAGCVLAPDGSVRANGIRESGEPGIPGVEVRLHFGTCSEPVVATQLTGSFGEYIFDGILAFGPHCVSIDAQSPVNQSVLIPGVWTFPTGTTGSLAVANFNLESGSNIQQDFGWDFALLPPAAAPTAEPTDATQPTTPPLSEGFNVTVGANCRIGPGTAYEVVTAFPAGSVLKVVGRLEDRSWWLVEISPNNNCWISTVTGQFVGNPASIPVLAAPPTPTPGPTMSPTIDPNATPTYTPTPDPNATPTFTPTPINTPGSG